MKQVSRRRSRADTSFTLTSSPNDVAAAKYGKPANMGTPAQRVAHQLWHPNNSPGFLCCSRLCCSWRVYLCTIPGTGRYHTENSLVVLELYVVGIIHWLLVECVNSNQYIFCFLRVPPLLLLQFSRRADTVQRMYIQEKRRLTVVTRHVDVHTVRQSGRAECFPRLARRLFTCCCSSVPMSLSPNALDGSRPQRLARAATRARAWTSWAHDPAP
jgi:hypothetical protein